MIHFVYKAHVMCLSTVFENFFVFVLHGSFIHDTFVMCLSSVFKHFFVFVFAGIVYLRQTKNVVVVFSHVGREQKRPLLKVGALSEGPELVFEYSFEEGNFCKYHIGNIKHQSGVIVRTQELVLRTKPVKLQGI